MKNVLDKNIRQCLTYTIKYNGPFRWAPIVGFTKEEFFKHMEAEFEDGMTWENYGEWVLSFHIPKRCYNFKSIRDDDFRKFWNLKNITPRWKEDAQHQKKQISKKVVDKYSLWDILPTGNISRFLVD